MARIDADPDDRTCGMLCWCGGREQTPLMCDSPILLLCSRLSGGSQHHEVLEGGADGGSEDRAGQTGEGCGIIVFPLPCLHVLFSKA